MKTNNAVQQKSYAFALRIIRLYKHLCDTKKEYVLSKQLLRSGTLIGANVEEALGGQSKNDFLAKLAVAYKEARESHYWLRLLRDGEIIGVKECASMLKDNDELLKILGSIQTTMRNG